eukprot:1190332-Prymnesium_polylepis.1
MRLLVIVGAAGGARAKSATHTPAIRLLARAAQLQAVNLLRSAALRAEDGYLQQIRVVVACELRALFMLHHRHERHHSIGSCHAPDTLFQLYWTISPGPLAPKKSATAAPAATLHELSESLVTMAAFREIPCGASTDIDGCTAPSSIRPSAMRVACERTSVSKPTR